MWGTNPAGKTLKQNKYRFNTKFRAVGTSLGENEVEIGEGGVPRVPVMFLFWELVHSYFTSTNS